MRSTRRAWSPATLCGLIGAMVMVVVGASQGDNLTQPVSASASPTPLIWLDGTNPASYSGSGTLVNNLGSMTEDGTMSGTLTFNSSTKAFQFPGGLNGTAYIALNANMNNFSNGLTVEFEGEFGSTRTNWERIFDFAAGVSSTANAFWVGQYDVSNELAVEYFNNGPTAGYCHTATGGTALGAPNDRSFSKFLITIGDVGGTTKCRIYKNGSELPTRVSMTGSGNTSSTGANIGGSPWSLPPVTNRPSSFVGRSNFPQDLDLEGSIRYLRIYNQALSPQQAQANANRTATFDANGGTGSMSAQSSNAAAVLTTNAFTRPGYTFAGWNTVQGGTGTAYADGASYPFIADETLYAQWTANTLNVTYDTQGGSAVSAGTTTTGATIVASPGTPTRSGHTFAGWFTSSSGGTALTFPYAHGQTANFTLYAQWAALTTTTVAQTTTTVPPSTTTTTVAVVASETTDDAQPEEDLPSAGADVGATSRWAFVLVMLGAGLSLGQRRRRELLDGARPINF